MTRLFLCAAVCPLAVIPVCTGSVSVFVQVWARASVVTASFGVKFMNYSARFYVLTAAYFRVKHKRVPKWCPHDMIIVSCTFCVDGLFCLW
jgi:hypothetical protein